MSSTVLFTLMAVNCLLILGYMTREALMEQTKMGWFALALPVLGFLGSGWLALMRL